MATLFYKKIISGEIPSYKVAETEDFMQILDINPNSKVIRFVFPQKKSIKFLI
jgi:histidine triad (HIT) family protein